MVYVIWVLSWLVFFFFVSLRQATAIREEGTSIKNLDWPMVGFLFCFSFWLMIDVEGVSAHYGWCYLWAHGPGWYKEAVYLASCDSRYEAQAS